MTVDFGSDLSCTDDLDDVAREISGQDVLAQAIYRRLTTPRGQLLDDPDYGIDVRSFLSRGIDAGKLREIEGTIRQEVLKDERVANVTAQASIDYRSYSMTVSLIVTTGEGPFRLVFDITADTVEFLKEGA